MSFDNDSYYIQDKAGKTTGVIFSPNELESFLDEQLEDLAECYESLLAEYALEDREGALTHELFMKIVEQIHKVHY